MTDCLLIDCRDIDDDHLAMLLDRISKERMDLAMSYRFFSDKLMSAVSGYCMRLLERKFDCHVFVDENGKPQLDDCLHHFNVSHSGGFVAVAWSDLPVGVDVQTLIEDEDVAKVILAPNEAKMFSGTGDMAMLTRFWTRKESYLKLTGEGLSTDPRQLDVSDDDGIMTCPMCARITEHDADDLFLCISHLDQRARIQTTTINGLLSMDEL